VSDEPSAAPGTKHTYEGVDYFAAWAKGRDCIGCAFDIEEARGGCLAAPDGCATHGTIWLTQQDYITHRLKS